MEDLHNRRRLLDVTWQRRKLNLEKYRTLSILKCDLEILETLLKERYRMLVRCKSMLGDSALDAEDLLKDHLQLLPEAKVSIKMMSERKVFRSSTHVNFICFSSEFTRGGRTYGKSQRTITVV